MNDYAMIKLKIAEIAIPEGRTASEETVAELVESMGDHNLSNPILVNQHNELVAGMCRLTAAKKLDWESIPCIRQTFSSADEEQLAAIDENLVRKHLTVYELCELLAKRQDVYERLHPGTKQGAAQYNALLRASVGNTVTDTMSATEEPVKTFAVDTGEKLGMDARSIRRKLEIGKKISREAGELIKQNQANLTQKELLTISRMEPEQQVKAVERWFKRNSGGEGRNEQQQAGDGSSETSAQTDLLTGNQLMRKICSKLSRMCNEIAELSGDNNAKVFDDLNKEQISAIRQQRDHAMNILQQLDGRLKQHQEQEYTAAAETD